MIIHLSDGYLSTYRKLVRKNPQIHPIVKKKLTIFQNKPNYPSLKLHKLKGKKVNQWSITIKPDLKIIFVYSGKKDVVLTDIGSHDKVY